MMAKGKVKGTLEGQGFSSLRQEGAKGLPYQTPDHHLSVVRYTMCKEGLEFRY